MSLALLRMLMNSDADGITKETEKKNEVLP